jgi:hypothetical protein
MFEIEVDIDESDLAHYESKSACAERAWVNDLDV